MTSVPDSPRSLVRPYAVTRGRTVSASSWPPETVVAAAVPAPRAPVSGTTVAERDVDALSAAVRGPVWRPGEPGFADELASSYGTAPHRPRLLVGARDRDDVRAAVGFAAARGLPVAVQCTGHGAVTAVDDGVMISTRRMRELAVDPRRQVARVGAGVVWSEVIEAAAPHGLAPLCGSAPGVGVAGFVLGGGLSPVARTFGYAADHVVALEVVTADGRLRWVHAEREPELFWALRGGKGNLGVVTTLDIALFGLTHLYGGGLFFDGRAGAEVLADYRRWSASLPERTTTSLQISRLRPARAAAPQVHLRVAHLGDPDEGRALLAPMRAFGPEADTVAEMPFTAVGTIHDDPTEPAEVWKRGVLLADLPPAAVAEVLAATGPDAADPVASVEIRHLGGAIARRPEGGNAVGGRDAAYGVFVVDVMEGDPDAGPEERTPQRCRRLLDGLDRYGTGGAALNFLGSVTDSDVVATAWDAASYRRLVELKGRLDPDDLFRFGYAVPAGGRHGLPSSPEARAIMELARPWRSVAEISAEMRLPLGVVRVLLADLLDAGLLNVHRPPSDDGPDVDQLERVLRGLRKRL